MLKALLFLVLLLLPASTEAEYDEKTVELGRRMYESYLEDGMSENRALMLTVKRMHFLLIG